MPLKLFHTLLLLPTPRLLPSSHLLFTTHAPLQLKNGATKTKASGARVRNRSRMFPNAAVSGSSSPLDLTEENIEQVLIDAKTELAQLFDASVNITGKVELAELDGPYVTIRLSGRFWHTRSMVLARLGNYLKQRIPEILEVDIEDEKQLDDSPENF